MLQVLFHLGLLTNTPGAKFDNVVKKGNVVLSVSRLLLCKTPTFLFQILVHLGLLTNAPGGKFADLVATGTLDDLTVI